MTTAQRQRAVDLLRWAEEEGRPLPMLAEAIVILEDHGFVVDLITGEVLIDLYPDAPIPLLPTPAAIVGNQAEVQL